MDHFLGVISYWVSFAFLASVFVFMLVYITAQGFCKYRKTVETTTKSREQFELLAEGEVIKDKTPIHVPVH